MRGGMQSGLPPAQRAQRRAYSIYHRYPPYFWGSPPLYIDPAAPFRAAGDILIFILRDLLVGSSLPSFTAALAACTLITRFSVPPSSCGMSCSFFFSGAWSFAPIFTALAASVLVTVLLRVFTSPILLRGLTRVSRPPSWPGSSFKTDAFSFSTRGFTSCRGLSALLASTVCYF